MPVNTNEIIYAIRQLSDAKNLEVTVMESGKGACIAAACTFAGGLLAGPIGLGVGGTLGAIFAAYNGSGKFKSVGEVIMEMTPAQRTALAESVMKVIHDVDGRDLAMLATIIMTNNSLQAVVLRQVTQFFKNEMGMTIN
ncbi:PREDICTED: protein C19orf12 homolog [Nicrophorus vespilloides]|uniref:Protein C19orf12 homolog n=1 Tax=Nicrophorus vespilloides TaxID=110193 RepID=A0ABM1M1X5_NICVS|nr:PREDICTED: protein C19orf12 homolog [Nicrophorus vespilloides]XP_017768576.1 PREDICTED: protein C19orf12 homolog [Nicrophorus vespilloides]